jgi:hypothetical protein
MNIGQPLCALQVSCKPLRHAAPDAIFTQSTPFTQAFFRFLWESWETEAGKAGRWRVFQIPSIAQLGFRKLTLCQPSLPQAFQPAFHFSALNYGYYYLFSLSLLPLSTRLPVGAPLPTKPSLALPDLLFLPSTCVHQANEAGIQRSSPVFHAQSSAKVHTIKKKKRMRFPAGGKLLYSVASADSASIGFFR